MPPRTPSSSPHQSALPFIAQTMLGVLSLKGLCSLCIQHSQLGSRKRLSTSFDSKPSKAMNQHLHNQAKTSTATYQLCDKISQLIQDTIHPAGRTPTKQLRPPWMPYRHKLHQALTSPRPPSLIVPDTRVPHTLW